ncbi:MAG TPA: O-antigen ligase family protein [Bacteroidia bacterium]|nr:O-antigen ligase family protein [Bacteroidia bacterium]
MIRSIRFEKGAAILCILLSVLSVCFYANDHTVPAISVFSIAAIFLIAAFYIHDKQRLFSLVVFIVLLSIGISVFSGSELQFPTEPLIGLLLILFLCSRSGSLSLGKDLFASPISILIFLEVCWLLMTSMASQIGIVSFKYTLIRSCYALFFFFLGLQWIRHTGKPEQLFLFYAFGLLLPVIRGMIFHAHFGFSHQTAYQMPKPFFNDHTIYGACIAFVLPMLACLVFGKKHFRNSGSWNIILVMLFVFLFIAEFLSYSRAAWLSLLVAAVLGILLWMRIRAWQLAMLLLVIGSGMYLERNFILAKLDEKKAISTSGDLEEHVKSIANIETDASNKERINRWKCAIRMGNERPLFGFGPRTYKFLYWQYQQEEDMTYTSTFYGNKGHSHSEYLSAYAEEGIPGFMLHSFLFLGTLLFGVNVARNCRDKKNRLIAIGALLGFSTYFVHGFFNSFMEDDKMASLVFIAMAILVYIREQESKAIRNGSHSNSIAE